MSYIERETVKAMFNNTLISKAAKSIIDDCPAADVVEVVRCKDCKKAKKTLSGYYTCPYTLGISHYPRDYCSYGERKEE